MVKAGLAALEIRDRQLGKTARGTMEKRALAWWMPQRTTVGRQWVGSG
jgi:hypothetical protein